jgi:hypothetical protein
MRDAPKMVWTIQTLHKIWLTPNTSILSSSIDTVHHKILTSIFPVHDTITNILYTTVHDSLLYYNLSYNKCFENVNY